MSQITSNIGAINKHCNDDIATIYQDHHSWLYRWLGKKLSNKHDAADISQDTFVKLITSNELNSLREPRAYLLVIANRLLINRYRRKKVEREVLQQITTLVDDCDTRSPEKIHLSKDLLKKIVLLLLEELPEKPRRAFIMAKIDGLTYSMIAKELNVSESSVKQYLAKVIIHCHQRMYDWETAASSI